MPKITNISKVLIIAVVAVVVIVLVVVYSTGQSQNPSPAAGISNNPPSTTITATSPTQTQTVTQAQSGGTPQVPIKKSPPPPVIHFLAPAMNDIWTISTQNTISWSKAGNISGSISLIDASTKKFVGVILPQIGPSQTYYTWNTRDLLLDRSNPLKKDVLPGTYQIKIAFDGNNIQPIISPTFTITN